MKQFIATYAPTAAVAFGLGFTFGVAFFCYLAVTMP